MAGDDSLELFDSAETSPAGGASEGPLADRMRPRTLEDVIGQPHLVGRGSALRSLLEGGELPSLILWGPPGSGKTTLARLLASAPSARIEELSAVTSGVKEIRAAVDRARHERRRGLRTLLFIDEIHRLNRAQQDVLLPHVETGTVSLVGATTENPSFEVNAPLLSRCRVLTLHPLDDEALVAILRRALADAEHGLLRGSPATPVPDDTLAAIAAEARGDARRALGLLEAAAAVHHSRGASGPLTPETVREAAGQRLLLYDRDREEHHNVVSALIKSVRASDPDAALYYLARMLEAGEDPLFIARRLVIAASEDIGNADSDALTIATSAYLAVERIGLPEGRIPLAHATSYLACAPKSNAAYAALGRATQAVTEHGALPVPMHLRNAATGLMRELGYGKGYRYPHDQAGALMEDQNLPDLLAGSAFYQPTREGEEKAIADRLQDWREERARARSQRK